MNNAWMAIAVALATAVGICLFLVLGVTLLAVVSATVVACLSSVGFFLCLNRNDRRRLAALQMGFMNFIDNDFSVNLTHQHRDKIDELLALYNQVAERLRAERQNIYQRELLLDTVIQNSSLALVLTDPQQRVIYSNDNALHLLNAGESFIGRDFGHLCAGLTSNVGDLLISGHDGLLDLDCDGGHETYHLSSGRFVLNTLEHRLILLKKMTRELKRQEVETWKKVIRVISHELNNSLAPISSMAQSGKLALAKNKPQYLLDILNTIAERSQHLTDFVGNYARIAKLPEAVCTSVPWSPFVRQLQGFFQFSVVGDIPVDPGCFDAAHIQQVLLNLLKNAKEASADEGDIELQLWQNAATSVIEIRDRGCGMTETVMSQALLPFYTTKKEGSGIGLSLCREFIELHDGSLQLENRAGGGLIVRLLLPLSKGSRPY